MAAIDKNFIGLLDRLPFRSDISAWPWTEETRPDIYDTRSDWPKISIVTPSYNQGQFIEKTIRSILLQNYPNLEFIVIDGVSTDNSLEVIRQYNKWVDVFVSEQDKGQSDAINKGFSMASGDIMGWLNTDDFFLPGTLYAVANAYQSNTDEVVQAWVGKADKVDEAGQLIYHSAPQDLSIESFYHWRNPDKPEGKGNFLQPACFFTRRAWQTAGPLDLELEYCMDVALWLRMARHFRFAAIPQKLAIAVGHSEAKTTKDVEKTVAEVALVISEYGGRKIAQADLMRMVEQYLELKRKWGLLSNNPIMKLFKPLLRPFLGS